MNGAGEYRDRGPGDSRPTVLAVHCSGGSGRQWRQLGQALGPHFNLVAPDLIGCGDTPHRTGSGPFRLTEEARRIVALVDARARPVHLVGHSYGGGVALRVAIERPQRIASLSLYEPTAFHVLKTVAGGGEQALAEIRGVAGQVSSATANGAHRLAAQRFIDYWQGEGSFAGLKPHVQADLVRYIPKANLDFEALLNERTPLIAYRQLRAPLRILCGEHSLKPALLVAHRLAGVMNPGALRVIAGAGHMGPLSHAEIVARQIAAHIVTSERTTEIGRSSEMEASQAA